MPESQSTHALSQPERSGIVVSYLRPTVAVLHHQASHLADLLADESWIHHRVETVSLERDRILRDVKIEYTPAAGWEGEATVYIPVAVAEKGSANASRVQSKGADIPTLSESEARTVAADALVRLAGREGAELPAAVEQALRDVALSSQADSAAALEVVGLADIPAVACAWARRLHDHTLLIAAVPAGAGRQILHAKYTEELRLSRLRRFPRQVALVPVAGFHDTAGSEIEIVAPSDSLITRVALAVDGSHVWDGRRSSASSYRVLRSSLPDVAVGHTNPVLEVGLSPRGHFKGRLALLAAMMLVMGFAELWRSLSVDQAFGNDSLIAVLGLLGTGFGADNDKLASRLMTPWRLAVLLTAITLVAASMIFQHI
jgi:hypothetical protein